VSIRWITKVWSDSPYDGTRLLIHLALADISHDDGRFFASQSNLASKGRCSVEYVRKVINEMIADGHLKIITKGNSRGNATVYQLIWKKLPNTVGEEQSLGEVELPNSDTPDSPTLEVSLPNSTPYHPSYTPVLSTTKSDGTAVAVVALSEAVARRWWEKQRVKPLGKGAWHSLLQITKAAEARGYSEQQIEQALDYIGTVPTMRQMDLVLRGVGVKTKHEQSAIRAIDLAEKFRNDSL
jgi:hypothetical protein